MKRLHVLLVLLLALLAAPAFAGPPITLHASGAETGPNTGTAFDIGNWDDVWVFVTVTAGSGTVGTFDVWVECSPDGTNFTECAIDDRVKGTTTGAGPHTDNTIKLIAETAVTTSATYSGRLSSPAVQYIRARWNIAGTTPSETFTMVAIPK